MHGEDALVTTEDDLARLARAWEDEPRVAVDTEFVSERTYAPVLCLVQIATAKGAWLVDTLAVKDLEPLARVMVAPSEKVFHAASADVRILESELRVTIPRVFDTQLAAGFVGMSASMGLKNLVAELLDEKPAPARAYSSWDRRPLSREQIRYALDDVRHLLHLANVLEDKLEATGRDGWCRELHAERLEEWRAQGDAWGRFAGRALGKGLDAKGTGALKAVVEWRDRVARERNWPPSRLAKDATLLDLAKERPVDVRQLREFRGLSPEFHGSKGNEILDALAQGAKSPIKVERVHRERKPFGREDAVQFLQLVTAVACRDLAIAPDLLATRAILEGVVDRAHRGDDPLGDPHFDGWRRAVMQPIVAGLLEGNDSLALELKNGEFRMVRKRK